MYWCWCQWKWQWRLCHRKRGQTFRQSLCQNTGKAPRNYPVHCQLQKHQRKQNKAKKQPKKKIVLTRTIAQKNRKEKKKKRPMDLAQCQDPCFPFPTQCTLNNTSFSQQGPPGPVFVFLPCCVEVGQRKWLPGASALQGCCSSPVLWIACSQHCGGVRILCLGCSPPPQLSRGEQQALEHLS